MNPLRPANLLLVDDRPENLLAFQTVLAELGQNVVSASSGREALRHCLAMDFAVILLDVVMPELDGGETARLIRERTRSSTTPIIFLTALDKTQAQILAGYMAGAVDYLVKPLEEKTLLLSKVRVFVELYQQRELLCQHAEQLMTCNSGLRAEIARRTRAERDLRQVNEELESRVALRTSELTLANERLKQEVLDRKQAQAEIAEARARLESLSRQLIGAQEAERRHLALELHDELSQYLAAAKLNVELLERASDADLRRQRGKDAVEAVEQLIKLVRQIAVRLRPPLLDELGLVSALRGHLDRLGGPAGLAARLVADETLPRLDPAREIACFRVAQEVLNNALRHAQARTVTVELRAVAAGLQLTVRDGGQGFDPAAAREDGRQGKSLGLLGLSERVALAGGQFECVSKPGQGTEVKAWFPLEAGGERAT
jgi:signal transduction histidine kinase